MNSLAMFYKDVTGIIPQCYVFFFKVILHILIFTCPLNSTEKFITSCHTLSIHVLCAADFSCIFLRNVDIVVI